MAQPKTPGCLRGTVHGASFQNLVTFTIRAVPLPDVIADFLRSNLIVIKRLLADWTRSDGTPSEEWNALQAKCDEAGSEWAGIVDNIWALGPQGAGECLLIDTRKVQERQS